MHAPKTAAHKKHPTNILHRGKHFHGIALALPKRIKCLKQPNSYQMPNTEF